MLGLENPLHLAFLLMILVLVFGAKRLPEMGRSLGAGLRGFRDSISGETTAEPTEIPSPVSDMALPPAERPEARQAR
jgi:sec-independent protein translocase protein TatA